ncbi:MAG: YebC/PmpR family DNA-binding transcriptional regulator [Kiritimatiellae bacterium]|nr:YebC/PmpR family DNA-binding transcriptional regulator [Kiritimatiellia bacterium]
MSGHSKWATIKHKKGAADAKRGKIFSKIAKEIMILAKQGGGDPNANAALRNMLAKAKSVNMPNDNIERAIKKGTGEGGTVNFEEITYEGYASGGVGLIVKVLTDNKNRAAAEIGNIFKKNGSEFAKVGSVSRNFERKGQIVVEAEGQDEDTIMMLALDAGADDVQNTGDTFEIYCNPETFAPICDALEKAGIPTVSAEASTLIPLATTNVSDISVAKSVQKFIDALEDYDDVQDVYSTMEIDDSIAAQLEDEE